MKIKKKSAIEPIVELLLKFIEEKDYYGFVGMFNREIISKNTKFPLLEYATRKSFVALPDGVQIAVCDKIDALSEIGSSVVTGIALQIRLENHFDESIAKSVEYIKNNDECIHCDHIGKHVLGFALLNYPEQTLNAICTLIADEDKWVIRMVGVAGHHAVKNGLNPIYVDRLFSLLLSRSDETDFDAISGLRRAVKTTAKFHPDIVETYRDRIDAAENKGEWFFHAVSGEPSAVSNQ